MAPPLLEGFRADCPYWLSDEAFRDHFRKSPVKRAKRAGMLRNVCTALGNWGCAEAVPALGQALMDSAAFVRQHAVWALSQVWVRSRAETAHSLLQKCTEREEAVQVRRELTWALGPDRQHHI